jgi:hypothetical protein
MSITMSDSQTITLPTRHPKWCQVDSHQGVLDDLLDDYEDEPLGEEEVDRVRKHWAMAGEHFTREDGSWIITLEQQPAIDDRGAGHPFVSLGTMNLGRVGGTCVLNITSGEARVLAAQLTAAADKIDL